MMKDTSLNEECKYKFCLIANIYLTQRLASRKETRRPRTTDVVARRLIGHALGIKMTKTSEQKQVDDALLRTTRG
jgi:hypothetical protein